MRRQSALFFTLFLLLLIVGYAAGCATASGQPHMQAAVDQLQEARAQLNQAIADKGGHRERAIRLIDEAIGQVQEGMEFARTH